MDTQQSQKSILVSDLLKEDYESLIEREKQKLTTSSEKRLKKLTEDREKNLEKASTEEKKEEVKKKFDQESAAEKERLEKDIASFTKNYEKDIISKKEKFENKYGISVQSFYPKEVFSNIQRKLGWYDLKEIKPNNTVKSNDEYNKEYQQYWPLTDEQRSNKSDKTKKNDYLLWLFGTIVGALVLLFLFVPVIGAEFELRGWGYFWLIVGVIIITIGVIKFTVIPKHDTWDKTKPAKGIGDEKYTKKTSDKKIKSIAFKSSSSSYKALLSFPYSTTSAETQRRILHDRDQKVNVFAHESSFELPHFPKIKSSIQDVANSYHPIYYVEESNWILIYGGLHDSLQLGIRELLVTVFDNVYQEITRVKGLHTDVVEKFKDKFTRIENSLESMIEMLNTKWDMERKESNRKLVTTCSHISLIYLYLLKNLERDITYEINMSKKTRKEQEDYKKKQGEIVTKNNDVLDKLYTAEIAIDALHQYDKKKEDGIIQILSTFNVTNGIIFDKEKVSETVEEYGKDHDLAGLMKFSIKLPKKNDS